MKARHLFLYLVLASGIAAALLLALGPGRRRSVLPKPVRGGDRVAVVDVFGMITTSGAVSDGSTSAASIIEQLSAYGEDDSVKALILRIDSPGGTVVAAQEIYNALRRLKEEKNKMIVASMADVAASGGYYVSCAADRIYANPGTLTGSIGVIMTFPHVQELMDKIGVGTTTIKSGEFKDTGSAFRQMSEREKEFLQDLIDNVYGQFVEAVMEGRRMGEEEVRSLADGRVYTGSQARELGLVDELGDLETAVRGAAELAGIEGKPEVVRKKRRSRFWELLEGRIRDLLPFAPWDAGPPGVRLLYLWR